MFLKYTIPLSDNFGHFDEKSPACCRETGRRRPVERMHSSLQAWVRMRVGEGTHVQYLRHYETMIAHCTPCRNPYSSVTSYKL